MVCMPGSYRGQKGEPFPGIEGKSGGEPPRGYWNQALCRPALNCLVISPASFARFLQKFFSGPGRKMWL